MGKVTALGDEEERREEQESRWENTQEMRKPART